MKIAISTAVYYPMTNGVATFSHNLALGLAARGHQVMVLCPSQNGKHHVEYDHGVKTVYIHSIELPVYPDQIHPIPAKKKLFGKEMPRIFYKDGFRVSAIPNTEVKKALKNFRPDVIHCQVSDLIGISTIRYAHKNNIPLITTEHNKPDVITDPLRLPKLIKKPVDAILTAYFVNRQKKSDYVTMPTQMAINDLILSRKKSFHIPTEAVSNGVDLSHFNPGKAPEIIYKKYHVPNNLPTVLYVGRVDPEKRIGCVIEAFSKVLKKVPEAIMLVVGDGVDRVHLTNLTSELGLTDKVYFLGRVMPPDLYDVYKMGTLFATASEIETQGIVLIEAAATGLPLVAVDGGAVKEICRNKENGFLCKTGDVVKISSSITKILQDKKLQKDFSKKSLELAKFHDINRTISRFEEIYTEIINKK